MSDLGPSNNQSAKSGGSLHLIQLCRRLPSRSLSRSLRLSEQPTSLRHTDTHERPATEAAAASLFCPEISPAAPHRRARVRPRTPPVAARSHPQCACERIPPLPRPIQAVSARPRLTPSHLRSVRQ
ncbi:hypothetical protein NDU88_000125 [Pleurodeles waltl]|uniref:Uncharacterized protein n=1 Tax=Pleurodeles waltl TaxID=8319 RepID=A0AAV7TFR5_PLEWA|nr:hypothetical protein NDU88_000125 [Pleurodeles waltl]